MANTYQILIHWDKGQAFAERMSAKIIGIEGYQNIDPQCPVGGPDGTKDMICYKDGKKFIVACYFPNGQKSFSDIQEKYDDDFKGVAKNNAQGFAFVTNQKITPNERLTLIGNSGFQPDIIHGERVCGILDSPKGYGIRLEYLGIEIKQEEQIAYFSSYLDLKQEFEELKSKYQELNKKPHKSVEKNCTNDLHSKLSVLPVAGIKFSSRLSVEDLFVLHKTITQETIGSNYQILGFRKVDVWIGNPQKENASFTPAPPSSVLALILELLEWWREEFVRVIHSSVDEKISVIALFHEKFLNIHPFLDGNGRVARVLASIQFKDLLDKDVTLDRIERDDYFKALQTAREGNGQRLNDIFTALIKE